MFFKSLYDVARHTAMSMIITPQGPRLRVIIMPKPGKDAKEASALSKPIEATGTPEELDAELPKAIADYAAKVNDLRATISVPTEALDAAKAKVAKSKPAKAPKAAKKPAAPKPPRAAKPKKAQKPKAPARVKPARAATARKASDDKKAITPRSSLPGKDKCLEDLRTYIATGKDLNRAAFIAWARKNGNKTGRRFEKLWSGWHEFVEGVSKPLDKISGTPLAGSSPASSKSVESSRSRTPADVPEPSAAKASRTALDPTKKWPFPSGTLVEKAAAAKVRTVYTSTGTLLGNCDKELGLGDEYRHPEFGEFSIVKVEDEKYIVQRPAEESVARAPAHAGADLLATEGSKT